MTLDTERELSFRWNNNPHLHTDKPTNRMIRLRELMTEAIRSTGASRADASQAYHQAVDQLIADGNWP